MDRTGCGRGDCLGCYLAGAKEISKLAGAGPLNTDDHPVVMFEAPHFVYTEQEPASNRLIAPIKSLRTSFHASPSIVSLTFKRELRLYFR